MTMPSFIDQIWAKLTYQDSPGKGGSEFQKTGVVQMDFSLLEKILNWHTSYLSSFDLPPDLIEAMKKTTESGVIDPEAMRLAVDLIAALQVKLEQACGELNETNPLALDVALLNDLFDGIETAQLLANKDEALKAQVEAIKSTAEAVRKRAIQDLAIAKEAEAQLQHVREFLDPEAYLIDSGVIKNGHEFVVRSQMVKIIVSHLGAILKSHGAQNYVQIEATHDDYGPLIFTVARKHGITPTQMVAQLTDENEELRRKLGSAV